MNKKHIKLIFSAFVVMSLTVTCVKEKFNMNKMAQTEWSPAMGVPLGKVTMALDKMLATSEEATSFFTVDDKGLFYVTFRNDFMSKKMSDFVDFPVPSLNNVWEVDMSGGFPAGADTVKTPYKETMTIPFTNGEVIDSMVLSSAIMKYTIEGDLNQQIMVTVTSPNIFWQNNSTFSTSFIYNNPNNQMFKEENEFDLSGCKIVFNGTDHEIKLNYQLAAIKTQPLSNGIYNFSFTSSIENMEIDGAYGYLGKIEMSYDKQELPVDLNKMMTGGYTIDNPQFRLIANNSFGFPITVKFKELYGENDKEIKNVVELNGNPLLNWNIGFPSIDSIGESDSSVYDIIKTKTNIDKVVNANPDKIVYQVDAVVNDQGKTSVKNFAISTSELDMKLDMIIPITGKFPGVEIPADTTDEITFFDDLDEIKQVSLYLTFVNAFPFEIETQLYFVDSLYNTLDSLIIDQKLVPSAIVGAAPNYAVTPSVKLNVITLDNVKIDKIKGKVRYFILKPRFSSSEGGTKTVSVFSTNYLEIKISAEAQVKLVF